MTNTGYALTGFVSWPLFSAGRNGNLLTHLVSTGEDRLTPSGQTILHYRRSCSPSSARILNAFKVCRFSAIASMTSKTDITTLRHFGFLAHGSRSRLSNLVSTSPTGKSPLRGIRSSNRDKPSLVVEADELDIINRHADSTEALLRNIHCSDPLPGGSYDLNQTWRRGKKSVPDVILMD